MTSVLSRSLAVSAGGLVALGSVVGFLATFEPLSGALAWRIGYSVLFLLAAALVRKGLRSCPTERGR
ncbi:MAG: hypothetical protein QF903_12905 [Planctomycetota bacterium]|nr:hypothetical protein [Planctomycetota bacterium]MDP6761912.1 hypothetical protein [Planctomycetota bacterium]MDP6990362.1 hypothetical protein [Planctomycetota bacterium]